MYCENLFNWSRGQYVGTEAHPTWSVFGKTCSTLSKIVEQLIEKTIQFFISYNFVKIHAFRYYEQITSYIFLINIYNITDKAKKVTGHRLYC